MTIHPGECLPRGILTEDSSVICPGKGMNSSMYQIINQSVGKPCSLGESGDLACEYMLEKFIHHGFSKMDPICVYVFHDVQFL